MAQPGNPKPRLYRLPEDEALINRLGFNNEGAAVIAERLKTLRGNGQPLKTRGYVSDVITSGQVEGVAIPDAQNVVADYPIALLKGAQNQAGANAFIDLVLSADGQAILKAAGFEGA